MRDLSRIALLIDFENFVNGFGKTFKIGPVLDRLIERGTISIRRAYGDWVQHDKYRRDLIEHGVELREQSNLGIGGKNGADIRLAIEATELIFKNPDIDTYTIASGDSDFLPLVQKLREYGRYVIVISSEALTSSLLAQNCDEFIATETLGEQVLAKRDTGDAIDIVKKAIEVLIERGEPLLLSALKPQIQNLNPTFDEKLYGFNRFRKMIEEFVTQGDIPYALEEKGQGAWHLVPKGSRKVITPTPVKTDNAQPAATWEQRPPNKEEWIVILEAIATCISDGEGKFLQGKLYLIHSYFHSRRLKGLLPLDNASLNDAFDLLVTKGAVVKKNGDIYGIPPDFQEKKDSFLKSLET